MFKFLSKSRIKFREIEADTQTYLSEEYAQRKSNYSVASPFGQLLRVLGEYIQLVLFYIEDNIVELNILTATKQRAVHGLARVAGHNPTRVLSATGSVRVRLTRAAASEVNASYIVIPDGAKIKCKNNGLDYFVQLGNAMGGTRVQVGETEPRILTIVQGTVETQTFLGTGKFLQSFVVLAKRPIENELVWVKVNGEPFEVVDSLYDMRKGERLCVVKTGISGGVDLYFGNDDFGYVPPIGSTITVEYVLSDGYSGNVFSRTGKVEFEWSDRGYTNNGDEVDLNMVLDTRVEKAMVLGADAEDPDLTRLIAPKVSRSLVLANPDNYVNLLSRFNYSRVDAYTTFGDEYISDDNVVYLFLVPDLRKRLETNTDYFTVPIEAMFLDEREKEAVVSYINQSGRMIVSTELSIVEPVVRKYAINVFVRVFDWAEPRDVRAAISSVVTDYLLSVNRRDKIPKSDIISVVEGVDGVDSVNVSFVSQRNEEAIINGSYVKRVETLDRIRGIRTPVDVKVTLAEGDDPRLGLDAFGDVVIDRDELPVFRGGWYDRYGNFYEDGLTDASLCSLNVSVVEVTKGTLSSKISTASRKKLRGQ